MRENCDRHEVDSLRAASFHVAMGVQGIVDKSMDPPTSTELMHYTSFSSGERDPRRPLTKGQQPCSQVSIKSKKPAKSQNFFQCTNSFSRRYFFTR